LLEHGDQIGGSGREPLHLDRLIVDVELRDICLIRHQPGQFVEDADDHWLPALVGLQELRASGELLEAIPHRQAFLGLHPGRRDIGLELRHGRALALQRDRHGGHRKQHGDDGQGAAQAILAGTMDRLARQQVQRAAALAARRQLDPRRDDTEAACGLERALEFTLGRQLQLDRQPTAPGVAAEDAMGEVDLIGPEWRQPVHFQTEHLFQVVLRGQRQIQDLAQPELIAQADRDRSPPALHLLQQLTQTLVVVGGISVDPSEQALVLARPLQDHGLLTSEDQHRPAALAAVLLAQATRHQAGQLPEPPAEERADTALQQSEHIRHDLNPVCAQAVTYGRARTLRRPALRAI
jgi:hypothetical protein